MPHSRLIHNAGRAGLVFLALALPASAGTIPADALPLPNRAAAAEIIVVGKVTAIEDKTVMVAPFPGAKNKTEYKIAVVTISDALMAPKGLRTVRLGFVPIPPGVMISPRPLQPAVGMEGCFFLTKHGESDFQVAPGQLHFIDKQTANFDKDIVLIKRCATILDDANAALKAKNAEDRFLAAAMLLARYSARKSPNSKSEPIEAEESKLILEALAAADWTPSTDMTRLSPLMVLHRLPLTKKDGWAPPPSTDRKAYAAYAQQWLKDHASSYRIQRFVVEKTKMSSTAA
jgi:hypothetical protein